MHVIIKIKSIPRSCDESVSVDVDVSVSNSRALTLTRGWGTSVKRSALRLVRNSRSD